MNNQYYKIRIKKGEQEIEIEGDKEFLEKIVNDWDLKNLLVKPISFEQDISGQRQTSKILTLKEFCTEKSPSTQHETIAVFAYYLKKYENKEEFTIKDIEKCYPKARVKKPKNMKSAFQNAIYKYAFIEKGSKNGYWKLTDTGEVHVKEELPPKKE